MLSVIQPPREEERILCDEAMHHKVLRHHLCKPLGSDGHDLAVANRDHHAHVHPMFRPQHRLRNPILMGQDVLSDLLVGVVGGKKVDEATGASEVHLRARLAGKEQLVVACDVPPSNCEGGDALHHDLVLLVDLVEEGMDLEVRHRDLALQLVHQLLRQHVEDLHTVGGQGLGLPLPSVLNVPLDTDGQHDGHLVLPQVSPQLPELLRALFLQRPELCERSGDAAHDIGEADKSEDDDDDAEQAFQGVVRLDVHRGGRELRHGPMVCGEVLVEPIVVFEAVHLHPSVRQVLAVGDGEPSTCQEVVDHEEQGDHLEDVDPDACAL
mmetsp:Transcript_87124/g.243848  ORF Transcript_87124/g.243848 Transcript_87124/m.243848 type:complete len:324 (-) Transcript_87124:659-1630(-)